MKTKRRKLLATTLVVCAMGLIGTAGTWAAYTATTTNSGNSEGAGSVTLSDNDSDTAMLSLSSAQGGASDTSCIKVSYSGSLPSAVRLYGTTTGTGLDPYVSLTITRGSYSPSEPAFDSCTNFVPDGATYITGQGPGVVYAGTLQDFPDSYAAGLGDPPATDPESWTTGESHVYKIQLAVGDKDAAAGKNATQTFTWEAHNESHYTSTVLSTPGLVSYWRLGESSGTTANDLAGTNDGTYTNGVTLAAGGAIAGDANTAASFDGTNDHVWLGDPAALKVANPSVEAWVKTSDTDGMVFRVRWYGYSLWLTGGKAQFEFNDSAANSYAATSAASVNDNAWHHLVGTFDGTTVRVYVDGVEAGSTSASAAVHYPGGSNGIAIGRDGNADATYLAGVIDEVAVYNVAPSATQVKQHYDAGMGS